MNLTFDQQMQATALLTICSCLLIITRRYKNPNSRAGYGIAGWTVVILLAIWTGLKLW